MVGPNNAGKSTLISALKTAGLMLEHASRYRPQGRRIREGERFPAHEFAGDQFGFEDLETELLRSRGRHSQFLEIANGRAPGQCLP